MLNILSERKNLRLLLPSHWMKKIPKEKKRYVDLIFGGLLVVIIPHTIASLRHQKTTLTSGLVYLASVLISWTDNLKNNIQQSCNFVKIKMAPVLFPTKNPLFSELFDRLHSDLVAPDLRYNYNNIQKTICQIRAWR